MRYLIQRTYAHVKKHDSSCSQFVTLLEMEPVEEELISKKKTVSAAWIFFDSTAICRLCKRSVSAKGGNTSNLFSHLRQKHPRQFSEIKAECLHLLNHPHLNKRSTNPSPGMLEMANDGSR